MTRVILIRYITLCFQVFKDYYGIIFLLRQVSSLFFGNESGRRFGLETAGQGFIPAG
jgi:hypothetical protein